MKDLTIWQFFAHADVLSGQDVNAMERACQVIETVRHRSTGRDSGYEHTAVVYRNLVTEFEQAFASWTDAPGRLAQDRFKELQAWHELFDDEFFKLSVNLVKFGAVIETARKNVNELMGNIVDALQAWSAESDFGDGGLLAFIGKILEFAVSKLDPSGAAALVFSEILGEIVGEAEATPDKDTGRVHGDSCYGILGSFLVAAQDVCESAAKTTEDLEAEVRGLHTTIPPVPTLPD